MSWHQRQLERSYLSVLVLLRQFWPEMKWFRAGELLIWNLGFFQIFVSRASSQLQFISSQSRTHRYKTQTSEVAQMKAQNRRENPKLYETQCETGWGGQVEQGQMCTTACFSAEWRWAAWVHEVRHYKEESIGLEKKSSEKEKKKGRRNLLFKCHSLSIRFMIWEILHEWHIMWDTVMWSPIPGDALRN